MEAQLQGQSEGVIWSGFDGDSIRCVFEQRMVGQKDEKYEFPCPRANSTCCGRMCCASGMAGIPLWLLILLLLLLLVLMVLLCATLAWWLSKRKPKLDKKKGNGQDRNHNYQRVLKQDPKDRQLVLVEEEQGSNTAMVRMGGTTPRGSTEQRRKATWNSDDRPSSSTASSPQTAAVVTPTSQLTFDDPPLMVPPPTGPMLQEKFIPSPMSEDYIEPTTPKTARRGDESDFTREQKVKSVQQAPPKVETPQIAYYRPFVPSPMEETLIGPPDRSVGEVHHISEISTAQKPQISHVQQAEQKVPEHIYYRPGFDNVPSY